MLDLRQTGQPLDLFLAEQLEQISVIFERQLASDFTEVNALCVHIESYRGKMFRPVLLLLSGLAGVGSGPDSATVDDRHRIAAAVIEMIHMATLVHDDVLDEAELRRGGTTISSLRGNEAAVILGDYLISNAFHLCSTIGEPSINLALGAVTNALCEGELVQLHHRDDLDIDLQCYLDIIGCKTGSLVGEGCRLGAQISGADEAVQDAMLRFGRHIGMAFQIRDDILDITGDTAVVGKSLGKDLDKGKLTLPIILARTNAHANDRATLRELLTARDDAALLVYLNDCNAIEQASTWATGLVDKARSELAQVPPGPARDMLDSLAQRVVTRSY
jgi:octaprenyl-diphosphate synthase